ncbi:GNAT family N-acetyltransferase [Ancylobacter sp. A5.8]|uniref:GNAT family N-acetyltransferase n=1 Tax=Ancylobacter gelatini TaxID=2919920 RepID=UPI001F4E3C97|nr:GNAT family N-acetyltransferase [Ancylobacter gelatini]MCJ8141493.1 GNAT family N-acetyltransferase [Ancylobacter gelatini]
MSDQTFTLRVESEIARIPAPSWNSLARTDSHSDLETSINPFISHEFLSSLEESRCVAAETGWLPQHLVLEAPDGTVLGVCPAYLKSHSQGEYVFDHGWADAYERAGGRYYPKLQVSVPFTPAAGPRLLVGTAAPAQTARNALAQGLKALAGMRNASSVHATFLNEADASALEAEDFLPRIDQQFHWTNKGYASYEDFLSELASRKRKAIKRERREALADRIEIEALTGAAITEEAWDAFFRFYIDTGSRKWGRPYLNRQFYTLIGERMADRVLLVMARRAGRYIAGAINFIGADTLYGRHWGCVEDHPFLHFEVCYHQAIDFAIARGLKTVEAGAQGEHKLARGYLPVTTRSAHYIADPGFREAVAHYLARERRHVESAGEKLAALGPFHRIPDEA